MTHREQTIRAWKQLFSGAAGVIERDAHRIALSLEAVAAELAVSPRHLQRVFAEVAGTTFRAYVDAVRMERAAALLQEERPGRSLPVRPVQEVAEMVGYNQRSGFAKAFQRYWGTPPSGMRSVRVGDDRAGSGRDRSS